MSRRARTADGGHACALVGGGRPERLLRAVHQRPAQCDRPDQAVPVRGAASARHRVRARAAGAGHRAAAGQSVLRLSRLAAREEGGALRRDGDALRAERAAHVHRRVAGHAADLPRHQGRDARVSGRAGLVLHHRRDRAARRVRRAVDPQGDAARGDAGHAGRHLDRVHLDAAGVPDVGGAVDRLRLLRHRADRLDRQHPACRAEFPADWRRSSWAQRSAGSPRRSAGATT